MIAGSVGQPPQSQSGSITPDEAAQGQSYADAMAQGMNDPSQNTGPGYAGPGAGGTAYAPAGTTVTLSNGITVTRNANNQITATWQDGYSTGIAHPDGSYGVVFDNSGVYNADPINGEKIAIDPESGQPTEIGPSSQLAATATPWSYYHVDGSSITPVATIELDNPADVPLTQQDVPTVAINGGDQATGGSFWTQANNYAAQNDLGVMALNWAADRAAGQPLLSGALRTAAAVDEGVHRGVGNFVINTVGGLVNAVTHPVQTVVGVVKAGVAALDYIGGVELGEVNPLSDAYNLATSSYNNAVNGFNQEVQTQGSYAAIRDASAGGTEVALNVGSAFVPGLDAADAARGIEVASDIGRAGDITEAAEVVAPSGEGSIEPETFDQYEPIEPGPTVKTEGEASNVWKLGPGPRGEAIEQAFGHNLPGNFPVIDRFENGVATSIKSIDLDGASYLTGNTLRNTLTGYVDKVSGYNGTGAKSWAGVIIKNSQITSRGLDLVIPHSGTAMQQQVINEIVKYGASRPSPVNVNVIVYH